MSTQKTVFWDFDNTLVEKMSWKTLLSKYLAAREPERGITVDQVGSYLRGKYPWNTPEIAHPELSEPGAWWGRMLPILADACRNIGFSDDESVTLAAMSREYLITAENYRIFADTIPALERLKNAGWRHIILSNHIPELPDIVDELPLAEHIDLCITSGLAGWEKPNPAIYRHALDLAGHPETVWMVGDSLSADVRGAEALGIPAILVRRPPSEPVKHSAEDLEKAAAIIEAYS